MSKQREESAECQSAQQEPLYDRNRHHSHDDETDGNEDSSEFRVNAWNPKRPGVWLRLMLLHHGPRMIASVAR